MDLRFYHDEMGMTDFARQNEGLDITYEDYEPGWGDARGIARTTEFRLWALDTTPTRERLIQMAAQVEAPPRRSRPAKRFMRRACSVPGRWRDHPAAMRPDGSRRGPRASWISTSGKSSSGAGTAFGLWRRHAQL
jgi:hypothetical protein